jgi:hypothetical protein
MKKILPAIVLLLHLASYAQIETKPSITKATFGRYGTDCSSGRGVCSFSVLGEESKLTTGASSWKVSPNMIILEVQRKMIVAADEIRIAGKPFVQFKENEAPIFIQDEPYILSKDSILNLELNPQYDTIVAGNYELHIGIDKVEIIFNLKSSE